VLFWSAVFGVGDSRALRQEQVVEIYVGSDGSVRAKTEADLLMSDQPLLRVTALSSDGNRMPVQAKWRLLNEYEHRFGRLKGHVSGIELAAQKAAQDLQAAAEEETAMSTFLQNPWKKAQKTARASERA